MMTKLGAENAILRDAAVVLENICKSNTVELAKLQKENRRLTRRVKHLMQPAMDRCCQCGDPGPLHTINRLRAALAPFAAVAKKIPKYMLNSQPYNGYFGSHSVPVHPAECGDYRRAEQEYSSREDVKIKRRD